MENDFLAVMSRAAEAGGAVSMRYFGSELDVKVKSMEVDFQTRADVESEQAILGILDSEFPGYNIHAEESGKINRGAERTFIIDPLDGSHNFIGGIPLFSQNLALVEGTTALAGVIHLPTMGKTLAAERGAGVTLNGKALVRASFARTSPTVVYNCGYHTPVEETSTIFSRVRPRIGRVLSVWAPGVEFSLFAMGYVDGYISHGTEVYDFVAGKLLLRESGVHITTYDGSPDTDDLNPFFLASNGSVDHNILVEAVAGMH